MAPWNTPDEPDEGTSTEPATSPVTTPDPAAADATVAPVDPSSTPADERAIAAQQRWTDQHEQWADAKADHAIPETTPGKEA